MYARLIRWAFTRFYREFAWTYDLVAAAVSRGHWRDWALAAVPYAGGQVLELGCGTGNVQDALARDVPAHLAFGIDLSRQMLGHSQRKADRAGVVVRLLCGDASMLPLRAASFDTVLATFPSEYIMAAATLAEARRMLRPGGQIVIVLGAQLAGIGVYERLVAAAFWLTLQRPARSMPAAPATPDALAQLDTRLHAALLRAGFHVRAGWSAAPGGFVYLIQGALP